MEELRVNSFSGWARERFNAECASNRDCASIFPRIFQLIFPLPQKAARFEVIKAFYDLKSTYRLLQCICRSKPDSTHSLIGASRQPGWLRGFAFQGQSWFFFTHRWSFNINFMRTMDDAIKESIGDRRRIRDKIKNRPDVFYPDGWTTQGATGDHRLIRSNDLWEFC